MKGWISLALLCALLTGCAAASAGELYVDFYDVGKADAALITTPGGCRILVDTGTNKAGKQLVKIFEKADVDAIDVMIITHYDKDHVGGADKVLEEIDVRSVYMPVYDKESKQHDQFLEALEASPDTQVFAMPISSEASFELDGVTFSLTAAHRSSYGYDEENDFSLCLRMVYGNTRFLFPGDAEKARQMELLEEGDVACDVLKTPYHGRLTDASAAFLSAAAPKIAFVPDSEEESGSPLIYQMLRDMGTQVYSAQDGSLCVVSDGQQVSVRK